MKLAWMLSFRLNLIFSIMSMYIVHEYEHEHEHETQI